MTEYQSRLKYLLETYAAGISTGTEEEELFRLIDMPGNEEEIKELLMGIQETIQLSGDFDKKAWEPVLGRILEAGPAKLVEMPLRRPLLTWPKVAAAILLAAVAIYLFINRNLSHPVTPSGKDIVMHDVAPGGNKALLTLANGSTIMLDSAHLGSIAQQGNVNILKTDSGRLAYNVLHERPTALLYNILTTPRGGQYQLLLPDGSRVWLNAASSIKYPVVFAGNERMVEVTGETYFEVAHNSRMPFRVKAGNEIIEDLGTAFNISAYADEPVIKTTLVEGSVKVAVAVSSGRQANKADGHGVILRPGQQAQLVAGADADDDNRIKVASNVDIDQVVAWKSGRFAFQDADLPTVMRTLARWYDVDVTYEGPVPDGQFNGRIGKSLTLSQVLKILTQTRVKYKIEEGNKIIILKE